MRQKWNDAGKDKVVLHCFGRGKTRPNPSPFSLKFETFLRMAGIEYEVDHTTPSSSKGKSPWMTFNGEDMADSQFCIEFLSEKLDKDLNKNLSDEKKAIARSMRIMIEEHLYFANTHMDFVINKGKYVKEVMPPLPVPSFMQGFVFNMLVKTIGKQTHAQGIGRHGKDEVAKLAQQDLKALSDLLGDKPFIMGNEVSEVDPTAFAFLCLAFAGVEDDDSPIHKYAREELPNLKAYFERVKEKYYSDWDELLYKPEEKPKKKEKKEDEEKAEEGDKAEKKDGEEEAAEKKDEEKK